MMKVSPSSKHSRNLRAILPAAKRATFAFKHALNSSSNFRTVARETSFPFISADTFRQSSDIVIGNEFSPDDLKGIASAETHRVAMVELSFLKNKGGSDPLLKWVEDADPSSGAGLSIVFHNGDWVPSARYLETLAGLGAEVFCINILDGTQGVTPIPIGLENSIRRKNGTLHDFLVVHDQVREPWRSFPPKSAQIFSAFKIGTNPRIREPLARKLQQTRFGFSDKRLSIRDFRASVMESRFVLSPPGNGPDCYRTWETIYLGSVPIVLRASLAESLHSYLPIWAIEDWDEALSASDEYLQEKYEELIHRDRAKAFFPYWLEQISKPKQSPSF